MRVLLQRVASASVVVDEETVGQIENGMLMLVCAMPGDDTKTTQKMAEKVAKLRLFKDEAGKMNLSLLQTGGSALVVSQFTLAADTSRGNRPGFSGAAAPADAEALYKTFADHLASLNIPVERGRFGADMSVSLVNDGPVTIWLDSDA